MTSYTVDLRTLFEIRNVRDANELLFSAFNETRLLDERLLKEQNAKTWEKQMQREARKRKEPVR